MKFNKDTKLVKIDAHAIGYYSNTEAYGQIYIVEEIYNKNKSILDNLQMSVNGLDGKHSNVDCYTEIEKGTLKYFVNTYIFAGEGDHKNIDDTLSECVQKVLNIETSKAKKLIELTKKIIDMSRIIQKTITLTNDTILENNEIPEGTRLTYSIYPVVPDSDVIFEIDFSEFNIK